MLHICSFRLQGGHVGGDFCFHRIPVPGGRVASGLGFLVHLFNGCCCRGTCLLLPCNDLVVCFFLRSSRCIFGGLSPNRKVGKLFRERLNHCVYSLVTSVSFDQKNRREVIRSPILSIVDPPFVEVEGRNAPNGHPN